MNDVLNFDEEYLKKAAAKRMHVSFQSDVLIKDEENTGVMQIYRHLTGFKTENSTVPDTVHQHKPQYLKYGRPNVKEYFDMARDLALAHKQKDIAVMVCGPTALTDDCRKTSYKESNKEVTFDFHAEIFEF